MVETFLSPFISQCLPLSFCIKTSISELATYASFGSGGSHIPPMFKRLTNVFNQQGLSAMYLKTETFYSLNS